MENTILNAAVNYVLENSSYKDIFDLCIKTEGRKLKAAADLDLLSQFVNTRGLNISAAYANDIVVQLHAKKEVTPKQPEPTLSAAAVKRAHRTLKYVKILDGSFTSDIADLMGCCWTSAKATLDYLIHKGDVYRVGSKYYAVDHP